MEKYAISVYVNNSLVKTERFDEEKYAIAWVWACKKVERYGQNAVYSLPYVY